MTRHDTTLERNAGQAEATKRSVVIFFYQQFQSGCSNKIVQSTVLPKRSSRNLKSLFFSWIDFAHSTE
jgi:hypothetical protein